MADNIKIPAGQVAVGEQIRSDGTVISAPRTPSPTLPSVPASQLESKTNETQTNVDNSSATDTTDNTGDKSVEAGKPSETAPAEPADNNPVIDIKDFLDAKEITKIAEKILPKKTEDAVKPVVDTKVAPTNKLPLARDYSDIPDEDKPLFEKMSNEAFAKLKPVYLNQKQKDAELTAKQSEIEELKKGRIPDSYAEHPNAVVLTPEFEQASSTVNTWNTVSQHWEREFDRVKAGEATYQEIGYNKEGQLALSAPIPVDKTTETKLLKHFTNSQNNLSVAQSQLESLVSAHRTRHAETVNWAKEFEKKSFGVFEGEAGKTLKAIADDTLKNFPKAYHNNPFASIAAKAIVLSMILGNQLKSAKTSGTGTNGKVATPKPNGGNLSAAEIAGDVGNGRVETVKLGDTMEDFRRYKEGLV